MAKKKKGKLKQFSWRVEYWLYLFLEYLFSFLTLSEAYRVGQSLGGVMYRFSFKYRAIVRRNLQVAKGREGLEMPTEEEVQEVFRANGGNFLTILAANQHGNTTLNECLEVEGEKELIAEAQNGKGVILMLPHMGNWEVLTRFTEYLPAEIQMGALFRPLNNPHMNKIIQERRENAGMQLISSKSPAFGILKLLKKGGVMCILSDQKIGSRGAVGSFFGVTCLSSRLPFLMHQKTGAPLFTVKMTTVQPGRWKLTLTKFLGTEHQQALDQLAIGMQDSLPDCFWFHDRWQEIPPPGTLAEFPQASSEVFQHKKLPVIVESQHELAKEPLLYDALQAHYSPLYSCSKKDFQRAYLAVGESPEFQKLAKKYSLKKSLSSPKRLRLRLFGTSS